MNKAAPGIQESEQVVHFHFPWVYSRLEDWNSNIWLLKELLGFQNAMHTPINYREGNPGYTMWHIRQCWTWFLHTNVYLSGLVGLTRYTYLFVVLSHFLWWQKASLSVCCSFTYLLLWNVYSNCLLTLVELVLVPSSKSYIHIKHMSSTKGTICKYFPILWVIFSRYPFRLQFCDSPASAR